MSVRAPVGDINITKQELCLGRGICSLSSRDPDNLFLYYLLKFNASNLINNETGSVFGSVNKDIIGSMQISLPDSQTRMKIGNILNTIDCCIELNSRINDYLANIIEEIYNNWFEKHDEDLSNSTNGWHQGSIYELLSIRYGAPFKSSLFNEEKRGLPLIRIRDLVNCSPQFYTDEINSKATIVLPGDLLIGMDAEFRPHIWYGEKSLLNQRVCKVEMKFGLTPYLALLLLRSELNFIESYKTGTTVSHIGKADFDTMEITVPPIEEMKKFSDVIRPIVELMIINRQENSTLRSGRASQDICRRTPTYFYISRLPFRNHTETEGRWEGFLTNCQMTTAGGWSC
ncbi:hypothetical protein SDC9_89716 [bioreactor metagenome]|uniref:Type I restriction modification DNA specificity domain-containing protein n=1 Tax=bioreactor metagenome TaxID=1076179 RepID=A0A644ZWM0_9ZZZZ